MDHLLYGCAYYDEYMPYERLDKDLAMMKGRNQCNQDCRVDMEHRRAGRRSV